ncbi:DUF2169 domain-containing protein [Uliginosibacterium sp. H3]|uniref:DUF2169 domain-containing protein n=1 Tax=Uliginosibacterium silvisoli TaxID=3114758 RepID=A0ABU6K4G7_9RHOO|nr:DUF2169 domain-containing protein [Uliginosibacterium sp. H3]
MKTFKPGAVAMLTRTIEYRGRFRFIVTPMLFVSLQGPLRLRGEGALWQFAAEELGAETALDAGMPKVRGEYFVHGRASPPGGPAPACAVRARFAGKEKALIVFGKRSWQGKEPSEPEAFHDMPMDWRLAYGGGDFALNPAGLGHIKPDDTATSWALPQVEYPDDPSVRPGKPIKVAGFGARDAMHPERAAMIGTYDDNWLKTDFPGLARDVDWRHFNVTQQDQWLDLPIAADAPWSFEHLHPTRPLLQGNLPGLVSRCFITRLVGDEPRFQEIPTQLETVLFFPHRECAVLISRGSLEVAEEDAAEIKLLIAAAEWQDESRSLEHYAEAVQQRLDPENGHFFMLKEDDLLPGGQGERYSVEQFVSALPENPRPLLAENLRRRQRAEIESARAMVTAYGMDPDDGHAPSLPAEAEALPKRLEDFPAFLAEKKAQELASRAEFAAREATYDAQRRALFASLGMDYGIIEAEYSAKPKGPPTMTAQAQFDTLAQVRSTLAAQNGPVDEIDQYLEDPAFRERMHSAERQAKQAYLVSAHMQDAADRMPAERADWIRDRAVQHLESGGAFTGINLTGANLTGMNFAGRDFSGAHLEAIDFSGCDLSGCNFDKAVLARANLSRATLTGASLRDANLGEADLSDADFSNAVLEGAILRGAHFARARFVGANLQKINLLGGADFREGDLSGANAADVVLLDADLQGLVCRNTNLDRAAFVRCKLGGADFSGASLERASFIEVQAQEMRFVGARIIKTVFVGVNMLDGADFSGAEILTSNFRPSSMRGARFDAATIRESDFSSADLHSSSFAAANATDCRFTKTDLRKARMAGAKLMNSSFASARLEGADLRETNLYAADLARVVADTATRFDKALTTKVRTYPRRRDPEVDAT